MSFLLPERTASAVSKRFGEAGSRWLNDIETRIRDLERRWQLELSEPFSTGWPTNLVFPAEANGRRLVLKTGYPDPELMTELALLKRWRGVPGRVQLFDFDDSLPAMLMQRISPGTTFREANTGLEASGVASLIANMPVRNDPSSSFPAYMQWVDGAFDRFQSTANWLYPHIEVAWNLARRLHDVNDANYLLHGDLHHENMLLDDHGCYIAIDPKGVTGPMVLEYGRFLHNFLFDGHESVEAQLKKRAETFEGQFTREQLLQAGYVDCVLSLAWTVNDGQSANDAYENVLQVLRRLAGF